MEDLTKESEYSKQIATSILDEFIRKNVDAAVGISALLEIICSILCEFEEVCVEDFLNIIRKRCIQMRNELYENQ